MKNLLALAAFMTLSAASADVFISGPRTLDLKPGASETVEYVLTNSGDESVRATLFTNDYLQAPDGSMVHAPALSLPQSLARFMKFNQTAFVVPAKSSVTARVNVSVPMNAAGGYWGVVGVDAETPPVKGTGANAVGIHVRYAMVTALNVSGTVKHAISIQNVASVGDKPELQVTFQNTGNAYERISLRVVYQNVATGASVEYTRPYVVLPGSVDLAVPVPASLPAGSYAVFVTGEYAGGARAEAVGSLVLPRR